MMVEPGDKDEVTEFMVMGYLENRDLGSNSTLPPWNDGSSTITWFDWLRSADLGLLMESTTVPLDESRIRLEI